MPHKVIVNTQTPFIRFKRPASELALRYPDPGPHDLDTLKPGEDFEMAPGGVTRMVRPLLTELTRQGVLKAPRWVALQPDPVPAFETDNLRLYGVTPARDVLERYARAKDKLWHVLHGLAPRTHPALEDVLAILRVYTDSCADVLTRLHKEEPADLFYVHDFQQLLLGKALPHTRPRIFRWHIPVLPRMDVPRGLFVKALDRFDVVVVSTRGYARTLRGLGVQAPIVASYPYVDAHAYRAAPRPLVDAFNDRYDVPPWAPVLLCVARMDPIKGQDVAVEAFARVLKRLPEARLVLVGNGSFSSSKKGALGLGKGAKWRAHLGRLARRLKVHDRVVFTGHADESTLQAAYTRADAVVLPSVREGFGLAIVEGWLHGKPALVSRGAGVAELVKEGVNGYTFDAGDVDALAERATALLRNPDVCREMGAAGRAAARPCTLTEGARAERNLMETALADARAMRRGLR